MGERGAAQRAAPQLTRLSGQVDPDQVPDARRGILTLSSDNSANVIVELPNTQLTRRRGNRPVRRTLTLLGTTIALSAIVIVLGRTATSATKTAPASAAPPVSAGRATTDETALSEHFDAFLEPRIGPYTFPSWLVGQPLASSTGFAPDPDLAVYLAPLSDGWSAWVIPAARGVCLEAVAASSHSANEACASLVTADAGGLSVRYRGRGDTVGVVGLARNVQ